MYKQQTNVDIVNKRNVKTRAHGALLFVTNKPNNEKYKQNVNSESTLRQSVYADIVTVFE